MSAPADDTPKPPTILEWALYFAEVGFSVVPTAEGEKRPGVPWEEYQRRRPDKIQLRMWLTGLYANCAIGAVTGAISEIFVLDADASPGKVGEESLFDLQMLHGDLPQTWTVKSGGGGRHYYFRVPKGVRIKTSKNELGLHLDVRGEGGYIVLPPSKHPNGQFYEWVEGCDPRSCDIADAPDWLIELVRDRDAEPAGSAKSSQSGSTAGEFDSWGKRTDGREEYMRDLVWARMIEERRNNPEPPTPGRLEEMVRECWEVFERRCRARGKSLEADGRGIDEVRRKFRHGVKRWDTRIAVEAAKPKPAGSWEDNARWGEAGGSTQYSGSRASNAPPSLLPVSFFKWVEWKDLPRRQWLYPRTYVRKHLTATISPGGTGKSALLITEALAMVTGRDLLHDGYNSGPLCVWYWSGEDPADELQRQVQAAMFHFRIAREDVEGRLILDSGRILRMTLARMVKGEAVLSEELVADMKLTIKHHRVDVVLFDPLVTLHRLPENANEGMDLIAGALADVANDTNCAAGIAVHTRKPASGYSGPITSDDARGGGALVCRTRVARVLNRMTKDEAGKAGIEGENAHRSYFRISLDKTSLTAPDTDDSWRQLLGVDIPNGPSPAPDLNGDAVRVAVRWNYPDAMQTVTVAHTERMRDRIVIPPAEGDHWRDSSQATYWAGYLVAEVVGLEIRGADGKVIPAIKARAGTILGAWVASGLLRRVELECADRKKRPCIIRGDF